MKGFNNWWQFYVILLSWLIVLFVSTASASCQILVINEFMSSNRSMIADEDGDYEDWIELYSGAFGTINLEGFGLSDNPAQPFRWVFPQVLIEPGEHLLIWASGKDRKIPGQPLHTNFSIKSEGEPLLLSAPDGTILCHINPVRLPSDISYGKKIDCPDGWFYFAEPTPGSPNITYAYSGFVDPPVFSHEAGFYTDSFYLTISHPDPEVTILYTLDGSDPDPTNLNTKYFQYKNQYPHFPGDPFGDFITGTIASSTYTDSIFIEDRSAMPDSITHIATTFYAYQYYFPQNPVFKGTVVRAAAFKEGLIRSPIITRTFFVTPYGRDRYSLPVISISVNKDDLFDYWNGIYTAGVDFDQWRLENPDSLIVWSTRANFDRRGDEWEKSAHFEFIEKGQLHPVLSQQVGIRISGNESRRRPMKSLRVYARPGSGEPYLDYKFFHNLNDHLFKTITLRNSGQDYYQTFLRDLSLHRIVRDLLPDTQEGQPAIVFINGEYWGIHNIRERYDKHYFQRVYGIDEDQLDFLINQWEIEEGDRIHYDETIEYIKQHGLVDDQHYEYIKTRIDVDNFIDYQIVNIFMDNHDWPGNNLEYWRKRTPEFIPDAPPGHDGRWRWLIKDLDFGFGLFGVDTAVMHNMLEFATATGSNHYSNPDWATFLLRKFLENEDFKIAFINRFADLLNSYFKPEVMIQIIENAKIEIDPEIPEHVCRWKNFYGYSYWLENINKLKYFAEHRPGFQREHLLNFFDLEGTYELTVDVSNHWHGKVKVNTLEITNRIPGIRPIPYPWNGIYFQGVPITLQAIAAEGYVFTHWSGDTTSTSPVITLKPSGNFYIKAHFKRQSQKRLINYWVFTTSLPNDYPLSGVMPVFNYKNEAEMVYHSSLSGYPYYPGHPLWRKASLERRNAPTPINYRPDGNSSIPYHQCNMRGIQIRQPFVGDAGENYMIFKLPSKGFCDLIFSFAAKDEGAAEYLIIEYSTVSGTNPSWTSEGLVNPTPSLAEEYQLFTFDFTGIPEVNDNPDFKIRIRFGGPQMGADQGKRVTFNNFSLDGKPITLENLPPELIVPLPSFQFIELEDPVTINLLEYVMEPDNDTLYYSAISTHPQIASAEIQSGILTITPLQRGTTWITLTASDNITEPLQVPVKVNVYPRPFPLNHNKITFDFWDPDQPELTYPEHMLFVQGTMPDPGLSAPVTEPYYIPHNEYDPLDQQNIGFPYRNQFRTRINGLGENGVSFINSGTNRDLGGLLIAVDTRDVPFALLNWSAQTLIPANNPYAIRLQYRTNINQPFTDLIINNVPVEYISGNSGTVSIFNDIPLPVYLLGKPNLQILWKYYSPGPQAYLRPMIRLDEISLRDVTYIPSNEVKEIKFFNHGNTVIINFTENTTATLEIYNLCAKLILRRELSNSDHHAIDLHIEDKVVIARLILNDQVLVKKFLLR